jgi:hypothetical protein
MTRLTVLAGLCLSACTVGDAPGEPAPMPGTDAGAPVADRDASGPPTGGGCEKMDVLFVIDDSASMEEEQANLILNLRSFVDVLDAYRTGSGGSLDYRLGVTTTASLTQVYTTMPEFPEEEPEPLLEFDESPPANGALLHPDRCMPDRAWIERGDGATAPSFACRAVVGTSGSGLEMPLLMMERALTTRVEDGANAGFLRDDALLVVVILSDEDDCSAQADRVDVELHPTADGWELVPDPCVALGSGVLAAEHFVSELDRIKGDRSRWAAAVIAGPGPGECSSSFGVAAEAPRLRSFVELAGDNATFQSICAGDLAAALTSSLETFSSACGDFLI